MRFPKKPIFSLSLMFTVLLLLGCGVKGDPLPPDKPAAIGRGRPTYKRATEDLTIKKTLTNKKPAAKDKDDEDEDERE